MKPRRTDFLSIARTPFFVWLALNAFLTATVALAYVPMGRFNLVVSLFIASSKVALIAVVFMHLFKASALRRLTSVAGLAWLSVLFLLMFSDYLSR
jgi:cytochrome c oxidase subunit 4